jgi:hypothetical protein
VSSNATSTPSRRLEADDPDRRRRHPGSSGAPKQVVLSGRGVGRYAFPRRDRWAGAWLGTAVVVRRGLSGGPVAGGTAPTGRPATAAWRRGRRRVPVAGADPVAPLARLARRPRRDARGSPRCWSAAGLWTRRLGSRENAGIRLVATYGMDAETAVGCTTVAADASGSPSRPTARAALRADFRRIPRRPGGNGGGAGRRMVPHPDAGRPTRTAGSVLGRPTTWWSVAGECAGGRGGRAAARASAGAGCRGVGTGGRSGATGWKRVVGDLALDEHARVGEQHPRLGTARGGRRTGAADAGNGKIDRLAVWSWPGRPDEVFSIPMTTRLAGSRCARVR